jgi:hypothetical protein
MSKPSYDQLRLNVAELKEKVEALEIERDGLKLTAEGVAEAHEAAMEALEFRKETAERLAGSLQVHIDNMGSSPPQAMDPLELVDMIRGAMTVLNTTKNPMEIKGVKIQPGKQATVTTEQMGNTQIYKRINRACEIGVLKEVK